MKRFNDQGRWHKEIKIDGKKTTAKDHYSFFNAVMFSPEDLHIIKNGPSDRRRFMDMELCQLNRIYVHNLSSYNKILIQKNKLLKEIDFMDGAEEFIDIYNRQLVEYGSELIRLRQDFVERIDKIMTGIHQEITEGKVISM